MECSSSAVSKPFFFFACKSFSTHSAASLPPLLPPPPTLGRINSAEAEKRERRKAEKLARQAEEGGKNAEAESPKGGILQLFMGKRESYYSA